MRRTLRWLAPLAVTAALAAGTGGLRWLTSGSWAAVRAGHASFDALVTFVASVLVWGCFGWLVLSLLLIALSALPGVAGSACGALAARMTPALYRRAARIALGFSVAAGPVSAGLPAYAAPADHSSQVVAGQQLPDLDRPVAEAPEAAPGLAPGGPGGPGGTVLPDLDRPVVGAAPPAWALDARLPDLDRPVTGEVEATGDVLPGGDPVGGLPGGGAAGVPRLPNPDRPDAADPIVRVHERGDVRTQEYVVKRGDTLWDIARRHLPAGASAADIVTAWHRWYDANRDVVGDDPNLIFPGQILRPPPAEQQ